MPTLNTDLLKIYFVVIHKKIIKIIKESFLKYIGCGLNIALKNININHTSKVVEDNQDFPEVKAHFKLFNIDRNYSTTVCLTKKYKKLH